jgi:hypothetical protein
VKRFKEGMLADDDGYHRMPLGNTGDVDSELRIDTSTELEFDSDLLPKLEIDRLAALYHELEFYYEFDEQSFGGFRGFFHWINRKLVDFKLENKIEMEDAEEKTPEWYWDEKLQCVIERWVVEPYQPL